MNRSYTLEQRKAAVAEYRVKSAGMVYLPFR